MLGISTLPDNRTVVMKDVTKPAPPPTKTERQQENFDTNNATSSDSPASPPGKSNGRAIQQTSAEGAGVPRRERDSSWLELDACREHLRQSCPRQADECRYAHPEQGIYVKEGRVTCCYDFLKV